MREGRTIGIGSSDRGGRTDHILRPRVHSVHVSAGLAAKAAGARVGAARRRFTRGVHHRAREPSALRMRVLLLFEVCVCVECVYSVPACVYMGPAERR